MTTTAKNPEKDWPGAQVFETTIAPRRFAIFDTKKFIPNGHQGDRQLGKR